MASKRKPVSLTQLTKKWNLRIKLRLNTLARWVLSRGGHDYRDPMLIYVYCDLLLINTYYTKTHLNIDFVGSSNIINIPLILSTIYICIPVSGCVRRGASTLLSPGVYTAVKTTLMCVCVCVCVCYTCMNAKMHPSLMPTHIQRERERERERGRQTDRQTDRHIDSG